MEYGIICGTETERVIRVPTTGVFDFESLVKIEKAKYVDKTDLLYMTLGTDPVRWRFCRCFRY